MKSKRKVQRIALRECWNCREITEEPTMELMRYDDQEEAKLTCQKCVSWHFDDVASQMASEREAEIRNEEALYKYELPRW